MPSIIVDDINTKLNHLSDIPLWEHEKPYELNLADLGVDVPRTNCEYTQHEVCIRDVRSLSAQPSLDATGFQFLNHVSKHLPRFEDLSGERDNSAVAPYLQETIDLVKAQLNVEKVFAIDWRVRGFLS